MSFYKKTVWGGGGNRKGEGWKKKNPLRPKTRTENELPRPKSIILIWAVKLQGVSVKPLQCHKCKQKMYSTHKNRKKKSTNRKRNENQRKEYVS